MTHVVRNQGIVDTRRLDSADFNLVTALKSINGNGETLHTIVKERTVHDVRLAIDCLLSENPYNADHALRIAIARHSPLLMRRVSMHIQENAGWFSSGLVTEARDILRTT